MMTSVIGHVTSADGTRIGFERAGMGPPLVLVHGTTADRTRWSSVLPRLEERFTVYRMDRRGRGLSGDRETYDIEQEFEDVAAVVESISGPVDLVGHSYGAICAMEAALRAPNVRRLVLYEPPVPNDAMPDLSALAERLGRMAAEGDREGVLTLFLREAPRIPEEAIAAMRDDASWAGRVAAAHTVARELATVYEFAPERFRSLSIPIRLLAGSLSGEDLQAATGIVHQALPSSRVAVMEGQAHVAMTTAPDLFTDFVIRFLSE